jgi:CheY-like chemotaxis protein
MLHRLGYEPVTVAGTLEALVELDTSLYDAVISDYHMPGADGIALLRRVRARGTVPFILMSTALPAGVAHQALVDGADLAVEKSEVIESLPRLLERVLPARHVAPLDRLRSRERARPAALAGKVDAA